MGWYKPLLTLTSYSWYAADLRFGLLSSIIGFLLSFVLYRRKGYSGWLIPILGCSLWAYIIIVIAFLPKRESATLSSQIDIEG